MSALRAVEGIGDKLESRVLGELGGPEGLDSTMEGLHVDRLSSIEGIGDDRAVKIFRRLLGLDHSGLASTGRAREIRDSVVERICREACTDYGRNRARLLNTLSTRDEAEKRLDEVEGHVETAASLPLHRARELLGRVKPLVEGGPDGSHLVVVEDEETYMEMLRSGLNRFCSLSLLEERPAMQGEFVVYYYGRGIPDIVDAPNVEPVRDEGEHWRVVPDSVLSFYRENLSTIDAAGRCLALLGEGDACLSAVEALNRLRGVETDPSDVRGAVERLREETSRKIYEDVAELSLSGSEVLESMGRGVPGAVREAMDGRISEAEEELRRETGVDFSPFLREFPLGVDDAELEAAERELEACTAADTFHEKVRAASVLRDLRPLVEAEFREALELDYRLVVGGFALERGLTRPTFGDDLILESGLHLGLPNGEPVDYRVDEDAVLLTGANSGGKTTLLETLSQVVVMSHMGLPVPARRAVVEWFDELHFHSPQRDMDAGTFESFLRDFLPLCGGDSRRLVLADELEAVTELEAAAAIIAGFLRRLSGGGSRCVLVTHVPELISSRVDVRVDGIEAEGLDDDAELVVNRTPVVGRRASSTPELILQRLAVREDDELFAEFLEGLRKSKE
ncbi:MAG: DNA-binding protein MutS2 [Methanonatronarchaeales archaeon]|nr:DNA-binding protein MutS2 [Methanonatronarchaeales archaeon]